MWTKLLRGIVLKIYYPFLMLLGAFFKDKKEGFQRHVINLNNKLVLKQGIKTRKILLMLPHCLQIDKCDIRITNNIYNCKRCGRCGVKDLIAVSEEKKVELYMATGGSVARKIVTDVRPQAIVAVACERDLSSGIVDSYPLPVIGIHNERPYGPCFNTNVSIEKVIEAINALCP
ncbi:MAG: DUF116 domain-containing protein [Nitrospirae bacterium]|nr:DUF116 domain-containing protein [Nitrospirota bacterium]